MPWQEQTVMSQRREFVAFAAQEGATISALCAHYGISRKTGYKWLARAAAGDRELADRSRRPHASPAQTSPAMEARILELRAEHPAWGGRKLHHRLVAQGVADVPAPSTITAILRRHGLLAPEPPPRDLLRFEHPAPNELWQMDFMGHRPLDYTAGSTRGRCSTTTRGSPWAWRPVPTSSRQTVKAHLTAVFRRYGLPRIVLSDNGAPWATRWPRRADGAGSVAAAPRRGAVAWRPLPIPRPRARSSTSTARSPPRSSPTATSPIWARRRSSSTPSRAVLQPGAPARGAGLRGARQPLPAQSSSLPRTRSSGHLRPGRHRAHRHRPRLDQLAGAAPLHQPRVGRRAGGHPPHAAGRGVARRLLPSPGRRHRPHRPGRGVTYVPEHVLPISPVCTVPRNDTIAWTLY